VKKKEKSSRLSRTWFVGETNKIGETGKKKKLKRVIELRIFALISGAGCFYGSSIFAI
jgi:hypothetical protein